MKLLSAFLAIAARPPGAVVDVRVAEVVFGQILGVMIQAGMLNCVMSLR